MYPREQLAVDESVINYEQLANSKLESWFSRPFLFVAKSNSPVMCSPLSFDHDRGLIGVIVSVLNVLRMN
jgi:hypothetical protein